jgi:hypothetical protein
MKSLLEASDDMNEIAAMEYDVCLSFTGDLNMVFVCDRSRYG